jgi:hypothetical protein
MQNGTSYTPWLDAIDRRRVALGLAASPFALAASRGWADQFDVATPPVFAQIAPAGLKPASPAVAPFPLQHVRLLDSPWRDAQSLNIGYMKRLDIDRLLHNFRVNAGLPSSAQPLGGWEAPDCELRGHFVRDDGNGMSFFMPVTIIERATISGWKEPNRRASGTAQAKSPTAARLTTMVIALAPGRTGRRKEQGRCQRVYGH